MSTSKRELQYLIDEIAKLGYQPIGMVFYDTKTELLGIAPISDVPDTFVETIGKRLGGKDSTTSWQALTGA